jgi:hypothetical protein
MARQIEKIIVHCSATPEGRDVKMEDIKRGMLRTTGGATLATTGSLNWMGRYEKVATRHRQALTQRDITAVQ